MSRVPLTSQELLEIFKQRVQALRVAASEYDKGYAGAAKSGAEVLRTFVIDIQQGNKTRPCLLKQLGAENALFYSTVSRRHRPPYQIEFIPLVISASASEWIVGSSPRAHSVYVPMYNGAPHVNLFGNKYGGGQNLIDFARLPLGDWLAEEVIKLGEVTYSRMKIIKSMVENVGGHVDETIPSDLAKLMRHEAFRITDVIKTPDGHVEATPRYGLEYATTRQIVYEVQRTIDAELAQLCEQSATTEPPPRQYLFSPPQGIRVAYDAKYLLGVLKGMEEEGEGQSAMADEIRRLLAWAAS